MLGDEALVKKIFYRLSSAGFNVSINDYYDYYVSYNISDHNRINQYFKKCQINTIKIFFASLVMFCMALFYSLQFWNG